MKRILIVILVVFSFAVTTNAASFSEGLKDEVTREDVFMSLEQIVILFQKHAEYVGGAGFFYGIKSKVISFFSDSHRDLLQKDILRTPLYMLRVSGISDSDPNIGKIFVGYCEMMPSVFDTYESCAEKIKRSIRVVYPDEGSRFYDELILRMRKSAGVKWL